jgi:outer membrane biosynthesis protein TonB
MAEEPKFIKSPDFKGKHLSLHVSGASRTIFDGMVLVGAQWEKFVKLGFLVPMTEENAPKVAPPSPPPAPEEPASKPVVAPEPPAEPEATPEEPEAVEAAPEPTVPAAEPKKSLDELLGEGDTEEKPEEPKAEVDGVTRSTADKMMKAASKRKRRSRKS